MLVSGHWDTLLTGENRRTRYDHCHYDVGRRRSLNWPDNFFFFIYLMCSRVTWKKNLAIFVSFMCEVLQCLISFYIFVST